MAKRDSSTRKVFKPSVWADRSGVGYFIIFKMFLSMCYEYLKMASIKVKQILTWATVRLLNLFPTPTTPPPPLTYAATLTSHIPAL